MKDCLGEWIEPTIMDEQYATAAGLSASFIRSFLYNGAIILDNIGIDKCGAPSTLAHTYNAGFAIEGLSVWADVSKDSALQTL